MFDFVFSLRTLLLIIGALFVVGIYLWGRSKNRRNTKIKYAPRRAQFEPAKRRLGSHGATSMPPGIGSEPAQQLQPDLETPSDTLDEIVIADGQPIADLPSITREGDDIPQTTRRRTEGQMEMTFDSGVLDETVGANGSKQPTEPALIIALYVRPPSGHEFAGPAIVRSMNSVGLGFGEMDLFHHYGAGELRTESPLFSVANMVEPGYFDLQDIDSLATPGLAMFLRLPGALDGAVAFELFLNTAQRLAEALSGDLYGEPKRLLDGTSIDKMRRQAAPFTNAD